MDKVYETFGISEKEYKEYRNCLDTDRYFVDTDEDMCRILYLDGDDGVALFNTDFASPLNTLLDSFKNCSEVFFIFFCFKYSYTMALNSLVSVSLFVDGMFAILIVSSFVCICLHC